MATKLVRDLIPEIIVAERGEFSGGRASKEAYFYALLDKLVEEATEAREAGPHIDGDEGLSLADVLEVIDAIVALVPNRPVQQRKRIKLATNGGFSKRMLMVVDAS